MERGTRNTPVDQNEPQFLGLRFDAALFADLARQNGQVRYRSLDQSGDISTGARKSLANERRSDGDGLLETSIAHRLGASRGADGQSTQARDRHTAQTLSDP